MKENTSMNQETIKVRLADVNDTIKLIFYFEPEQEPEGFAVNLDNETGQSELASVFSKTLEKMVYSKVEFELVIDESFTKGLYKDVCIEYIKALNDELVKVQEQMKQTLENNG